MKECLEAGYRWRAVVLEDDQQKERHEEERNGWNEKQGKVLITDEEAEEMRDTVFLLQHGGSSLLNHWS